MTALETLIAGWREKASRYGMTPDQAFELEGCADELAAVLRVARSETSADTERLPTAEEVRGILAEYRDAGADEVHELPATSGGETGRPTFERELETLINCYSQENASDTPDFILAGYLMGCLATWNESVRRREGWYGRGASALAASRAPKEPTLDISTASGTQMPHPTDPTICWQGKPNDLTAGRCTFTKGHAGPHQWETPAPSSPQPETPEQA